eukprot:TRINITY_DN3487_c0_g1_i1.p1 TRINITY_DN3487_c0_g1~~TRINITY_DN3487_c0_g1_i1.p1  ORF type:complete len:829 (-),score=296.88 TRINITY_DN3487_c0_g1_i1:3950-6436(-)
MSGSVCINKHLGTLFVNVIDAKDLDSQGHSVGNVKVVLSIGKKRLQTKTRSESLSPIWNEGPFIFDEIFNTDLLSIDVRHKATVGSGFSFGEASFGIFTSPISQYEIRSIPLSNSKGSQGTLTLEIKFEPQQVIVPQSELSANPVEMTEFQGNQSHAYIPTVADSMTGIGQSPLQGHNPLMSSAISPSQPYYNELNYSNLYNPAPGTPSRPLSASTPVRNNVVNESSYQPSVQHHLPNLPLNEVRATVLGTTVTTTSTDHSGNSISSSQSIRSDLSNPDRYNARESVKNSDMNPPASNSTITVDDSSVQSAPSSLQNSTSLPLRSSEDYVNKERRGFLKAFREERMNRKNASFKALFSLDETERLIFDNSAAIQRNVLHHGKLYGSTHYLCFYSNVFGTKIVERVSFADVASIEKENRNVVNPGITVKTKEGREMHFASMASRRKTFHKMVDVWKAAQNGTFPTEERFSDDDIPDGDDSDQSEFQESKSGKDIIDEKVEKVEKVEEEVVVEEEKLDAELTTDPGQSILENLDKMVEVFATELPVSIPQFFSYFHSDSSDFAKRYHVQRGDKDIVLEKWTNKPPNGTCRTLTCIAPVTAAIGPKQTRLEERQRCVVEKDKVVIELSSRLLDIPYGDHFKIETKHEAVAVGDKKIKLTITTFVNFVKKTMFEGKIRNGTMSQMGESYQKWTNLAMTEIKNKRRQKTKQTKKVSKTTNNGSVEKSVKTVSVSSDDEDEDIVVEKSVYQASAVSAPPPSFDSSPSLVSTLLSPQLIITLVLLLLVIILMIQVSFMNGKIHSIEDRLEFLNRALLLTEMQRNAINGNVHPQPQ